MIMLITIIIIIIIVVVIIIIIIINILRERAGEQRTSSWLRARVAKGLRAAPLRQFRRAKRSKVAQRTRIPGSSVSIWMLCRNFMCWLPKIGLLLRIFHAPRTENAPHGYERLCAPSGRPPYGYARKKDSLDRWWPAVHQSCTQIQCFKSLFFSPLGPHSGSGAVPRTPALPGYCRGIAGT